VLRLLRKRERRKRGRRRVVDAGERLIKNVTGSIGTLQAAGRGAVSCFKKKDRNEAGGRIGLFSQDLPSPQEKGENKRFISEERRTDVLPFTATTHITVPASLRDHKKRGGDTWLPLRAQPRQYEALKAKQPLSKR